MKRLSELEYGESGFVREIRASQHELNCLGIRRKKQVKMVTRQPIKGPVVVVVDDMEVAMGLEIAEGVIIETDGRGRTGV
ncbi:iron transporter FeoA [Methanoculleus sediminis]|uniref:Iron transporter FeoA n=1 Tax=Methanoculleus sediminis TaxID=1550566 RepID=A0A0H1R7I3_9EURY|nr:FeoA family protein [Methanoculleus sediminis]KLK88607.1 iron transporter FeoA [Methanoculleus sediminis]